MCWPGPKNSETFHVDGGLPFERAISARPFWPELEVGTKSFAAANGDLESGLFTQSRPTRAMVVATSQLM